MRVVPRESIPETKLLRLAGNDRPAEIEAVIDANGRVKVNRIIDIDSDQVSLAKPTGRFAILAVPSGPSQRQLT